MAERLADNVEPGKIALGAGAMWAKHAKLESPKNSSWSTRMYARRWWKTPSGCDSSPGLRGLS
jgi:hypothetical protein